MNDGDIGVVMFCVAIFGILASLVWGLHEEFLKKAKPIYGTAPPTCTECERADRCKQNREDCIIEITFEEPIVTKHPDLF